MSGWFAVKRGITSHHLFKGKPERLAVWMWLVDNAAWQPTTHDVKGKTVEVPRGSVCVSERQISDEVGVGYQVVRTAIKRFKSEHMINATPTHGKNLITLCNYAKYQDVDRKGNAAPNATPTQRQRNANAQKEQGNKVTKEASASLDADVSQILSQAVSTEVAEDFVAMRREMRKPVTERSARSIVKSLDGHHDPNAVIRASVNNGWQGIFPDKITPQFSAINGGRNGKSPSKSEERINAFISGARGTS